MNNFLAQNRFLQIQWFIINGFNTIQYSCMGNQKDERQREMINFINSFILAFFCIFA